MTLPPKYIDIRAVFTSKNPRLARWIPGSLFRWIAHLVREKEINTCMSHIGHLHGVEFCRGIVEELELKLRTAGLEHIPEDGGVIIAANHPLGGPDGIALLAAVSERRPDMFFLVNDILMNLSNLEPLFVPVNKHGSNSRSASARIQEAYSSGKAVVIFPAGLVSRKQKTGIQDVEWSKSFITQSVRHGLPVIPAFISGRNRMRFYYLALWRKRLGIKANIEMFLLPAEFFKQRGRSLTITFGKPVPSRTFDSSQSDRHWASEIKKMVYLLGKKSTR